VPRVLIAALAGLLVGLAFITSSVLALHDPRPHRVPVAVAGVPPERVQRELDRAEPGGYAVALTADTGAAERLIVRREAFGALILEPDGPTIMYASAYGRTASTTVRAALRRAALDLGLTLGPEPFDVVPLQRGDPNGTSLQQVALGTIMAGFFMGVLSAQLALSEPFGLRLLTTAGFALTFGLLAALVLDPLLGVLVDHFGWVWLWTAAGAFTIAEVVRACARVLGLPGIGLAMLAVLIVGNPSAGVAAPPEFLPAFFDAVGPLLPPGATAGGILRTAYFDAPVTGPALVLAVWALLAVATLWLADRRSGPGTPLALDVADAAAAAPPLD
jgi:hypothetical protein